MSLCFVFLFINLLTLSQCSILPDSIDADYTHHSGRFFDSRNHNSRDSHSKDPETRADHTHLDTGHTHFNHNYSLNNSNGPYYYPYGTSYDHGSPYYDFNGAPYYHNGHPHHRYLGYPNHPGKGYHPEYQYPDPRHGYSDQGYSKGFSPEYPYPSYPDHYGLPYPDQYEHHKLRPGPLSHYRQYGYPPTLGHPGHMDGSGYPFGIHPHHLPPQSPTHYRPDHSTTHPSQTPTETPSRTAKTLIILDIAHQGPTMGYSVTVEGPKIIFRAIFPCLFGKVIFGTETLWHSSGNGYPNKVVYQNINGLHKVKVYFPADLSQLFKRPRMSTSVGLTPPSFISTGPTTQVVKGATRPRTSLGVNLADYKPVLISLSLDYLQTTNQVKHTRDDLNNIDILKAKPPYLFREITKGGSTRWRAKYGRFGSKVVIRYDEDGNPKAKMYYPDNELLKTLYPEYSRATQTETMSQIQPTTLLSSLFSTAPVKPGSNLSLFVESQNVPGIIVGYDLSTVNLVQVNKFKFVSHIFPNDIKCTLVKFKDKPLWSFNPELNKIPKSIAWHESCSIVFLEFDDYYELFLKLCSLYQWRSKIFAKPNDLFLFKIKLYAKYRDNFLNLPSDWYQFKNLGFAFEYEFKPGMKCDKLTYDGAPIYTYSPLHDRGRYPKVLYVFPDKTGHVFYPERSYYLFSPFDVPLVLNSVKKSNIQVQYVKTDNLMTYTANKGYRFYSVQIKSGSSCCSSSVESIWDGKYSFLYATKVLYDCRNPIKKTVTIHLVNGGKIVFVKPVKNKNWIKTFEVLVLIKLDSNRHPKNIKLFTTDSDDSTKYKELDSNHYRVKQDPSKTDIFVYELNYASKCVLIRCFDKDVWKYDISRYNPKYPKSINYNKKDSVFLVNIDNIVIKCNKVNNNWVCNELKEGIAIDLTFDRKSTNIFNYEKNKYVAIYKSKPGCGFNSVLRYGKQIWKTNKIDEYAYLVEVKNPQSYFIDVYIHLYNGTKLLYLKDSNVTGWYNYDLSKKNPVFVNINLEKESVKYKNELQGTTRTFTAKPGFVFNRVIQYNFDTKKNIKIWQTDNETEYSSKVVREGDNKVVVYIGEGDGNIKLFYKGFDGQWTEDDQ